MLNEQPFMLWNIWLTFALNKLFFFGWKEGFFNAFWKKVENDAQQV